MNCSRRVFAVVLVVCFATGAAAVAGEEKPLSPDIDDAALIVIDIQAFYFPGGMVPLVGPEAAASKAAEVIGVFRKAGRPVIHVQHLPKDVDEPDLLGNSFLKRTSPKSLRR